MTSPQPREDDWRRTDGAAAELIRLTGAGRNSLQTNGRHASAAGLQIRDRIKELRRVRASSLVDNPRNWRRDPKAQADTLNRILNEIGYANALLVRELPDGRLMLIDGHLRARTTPKALVPVLLLDTTAAEADMLLATLDPLTAMAEADGERLKALLECVQTGSDAAQDLLKRTAGERIWQLAHLDEVKEAEVSPDRPGELEAKWGTASGQLWAVGAHRIIYGDCRDKAAPSAAASRLLTTT